MQSGYEPASPDRGRVSLAALVNERTRQVLAENAGWFTDARTSHRYYRSDQFRRDARRKDKDRIRLIANFLRRDVDLMVAEVLDGKPVITTTGRNPKDYQLSQWLLEVLRWTRDEEENWDTDQERVITDCIHIGEGVLFEGWDQNADRGRGMPKSLWLDSRYVLWPLCQDIQKDDADYVIWLEHVWIEDLEQIYPNLKGQIQPENFEHFLVPTYASLYRDRRSGSASMFGNPALQSADQKGKAWVKRMWSKRRVWDKRFYYKEDSEPAEVFDDQGKQVPLTSELYGMLSPEEQDLVVEERYARQELWETVVINQHTAEHHLSPFDTSEGGHGRYPFAFFPCIMLADEARARGEISFLINVQDITNETVTMLLDQLFLQNTGYLNIIKGSLNPEERQKIEDIPRKAFSVIETSAGMQPPTWQGMNPSGSTVFTRAIDTMSGIMDKISGIHEPARGEVPGYVESGRAIRALQARSSLLTTKTLRHIESGLRRATVLRLYNIGQLMRGNRIASVVDDSTKEQKHIYIGQNELEIIMSNGLVPAAEEEQGMPQGPALMAGGMMKAAQPAGGVAPMAGAGMPTPTPGTLSNKAPKTIWKTPNGKVANILVLNDQTMQDILFEKIRLTLDTGVELGKAERMDQAQMVLQTVGAPALAWAATQLDWSNREELLSAVEAADQAKALQKQMEQISKQSKLSIDDLFGLLMQSVQQQMAAGPAGAPAPPGAPPVGPQAPELPPEIAAMMAGGGMPPAPGGPPPAPVPMATPVPAGG